MKLGMDARNSCRLQGHIAQLRHPAQSKDRVRQRRPEGVQVVGGVRRSTAARAVRGARRAYSQQLKTGLDPGEHFGTVVGEWSQTDTRLLDLHRYVYRVTTQHCRGAALIKY